MRNGGRGLKFNKSNIYIYIIIIIKNLYNMDTEKQIAFNMWVLMVLEEINVWKVDK